MKLSKKDIAIIKAIDENLVIQFAVNDADKVVEYRLKYKDETIRSKYIIVKNGIKIAQNY